MSSKKPPPPLEVRQLCLEMHERGTEIAPDMLTELAWHVAEDFPKIYSDAKEVIHDALRRDSVKGKLVRQMRLLYGR